MAHITGQSQPQSYTLSDDSEDIEKPHQAAMPPPSNSETRPPKELEEYTLNREELLTRLLREVSNSKDCSFESMKEHYITISRVLEGQARRGAVLEITDNGINKL